MHGLMEIKQVIKIPKAKKKKVLLLNFRCSESSAIYKCFKWQNSSFFYHPTVHTTAALLGACNKPGNLQYSDSVNNQRGTRLNNVTSMSVLPLNLINSMLKRLNNTNINFFLLNILLNMLLNYI